MPAFRRLLESPFFIEVEDRLAGGGSRVELSGLVDGSRALMLTLLASRLRKAVLLVVPDDVAMGRWHRDLAALAGLTDRDPLRIVDFPAMDADPYDDIPPHPEVVRERVVALERIVAGDLDFVLAPARALFGRLPSRQEWEKSVRRIQVGDDLPPDRFILSMIGYGYRRVETVSAPGEISRRGGIIDLFPSGSHEPVRIELFGDTVDSLRTFDTDHQRSTGTVQVLTAGPAMESPPTDAAVARVAKYLEEAGEGRPFRRKLEALTEGGYFPGFETLAGLTAENAGGPVRLHRPPDDGGGRTGTGRRRDHPGRLRQSHLLGAERQPHPASAGPAVRPAEAAAGPAGRGTTRPARTDRRRAGRRRNGGSYGLPHPPVLRRPGSGAGRRPQGSRSHRLLDAVRHAVPGQFPAPERDSGRIRPGGFRRPRPEGGPAPGRVRTAGHRPDRTHRNRDLR